MGYDYRKVHLLLSFIGYDSVSSMQKYSVLYKYYTFVLILHADGAIY